MKVAMWRTEVRKTKSSSRKTIEEVVVLAQGMGLKCNSPGVPV